MCLKVPEVVLIDNLAGLTIPTLQTTLRCPLPPPLRSWLPEAPPSTNQPPITNSSRPGSRSIVWNRNTGRRRVRGQAGRRNGEKSRSRTA